MKRKNFIKTLLLIPAAMSFYNFSKSNTEDKEIIILNNSHYFSHIEATNLWELLPIHSLKKGRIIHPYISHLTDEYWTISDAYEFNGGYRIKAIKINIKLNKE